MTRPLPENLTASLLCFSYAQDQRILVLVPGCVDLSIVSTFAGRWGGSVTFW